jgi:uncharacterized protein
MSSRIWVDADACPVQARKILYDFGNREGIKVTFVSNCVLPIRGTQHVCTIETKPAIDAADREIVSQVKPGDLIITNDMELNWNVVMRGCHALKPICDKPRERQSFINRLNEWLVNSKHGTRTSSD